MPLRIGSPAAEGGRGTKLPLMLLRGLASWGVRAPDMDVRLAGRIVYCEELKSGREDVVLARLLGLLCRLSGRSGLGPAGPKDSRETGAVWKLWLSALLFWVLVLTRFFLLLLTVTVAGMPPAGGW